MELFEDRIAEYKENEVTASPVWIWFTKVDIQKNEARCDICKKTIQIKYGSTSSLITHIKKCHGPLTKYNAGKILDELFSLKDERQKSNKRKLPSMDQQPQKKQRTISDNSITNNTYVTECCHRSFLLTTSEKVWLGFTSNGGYRREEKSYKHWSFFTMLLSSVNEFFCFFRSNQNCIY